MKRFFSFLTLSVLATSTLIAQAPTPSTTTELPFVVVEEFINRTDSEAPGFDQLKRRIENEIINTRKFTYLERGEALGNAMAERRRRAAGAVQSLDATPENATENAPLIAAGYAIYGDILFFGIENKESGIAVLNSMRSTAKLEVQIRLANIDSGEVLASKIITKTTVKTTSAPANTVVTGNFTDDSLRQVVEAAAHDVVKALMELAYPVKVLTVNTKRKSFIVNLTQEQTEEGKLYDVYATGDELFDPDTGKSLGVVEEHIGRATVTRCQPKMSFMRPVGDLKIEDVERGMILREVDEETVKQEQLKQQRERARNQRERF